jgi:hypothetical protein
MNREKLRVSRRRFLLGVGATALTLPFLRALPSYAQTEERRYLVLLFTPNGVVRHRWGADVTGQGPGQFTLRPFLKPLDAFKDKLIILDGLKAKAADGSHEAGMAALWTGRKNGGALAPGESIDQLVGREITPAGVPYKTLELKVKADQDYNDKSSNTRMIYSGPKAPVDPREDAVSTFDTLFSQVKDPGTTPDPAIERKKRIREKLFAHVDTELAALSPRLCSQDRIQVDALRTNWNVLRSRLNTTIPVAPGCSAPDLNANPALAGFPQRSRQMLDMLAMSIACDMTRVASLQFSHARSDATFEWIGQNEKHHDLSHSQPQLHEVGDMEAPTPDEEQRFSTIWGKLSAINVWYAQEVAYLAGKLNELGVLDRTAICWGNELDNGSAHDHVNHPFLIIGGCGGRLRTGQVVRYPHPKKWEPEPAGTRAHNDLLVTLGRAMGANVPSFGDADLNQGPLTEILV